MSCTRMTTLPFCPLPFRRKAEGRCFRLSVVRGALYMCFKDGLKICMCFFQNPEIIFHHFLHILNLDIF